MPDPKDPKKLTDKEYLKKVNKSKHYFNYSGSRSNAGVPTNYNEKVEFYPGVQDGVRQYEDIEGKLNLFNSLIAPVKAAFLDKGSALTTDEAEAISPGIGALEQKITDWMGTQSTMKDKVPSFTGNTEIDSGQGLSAQRGQTMWGPMRTSQFYGVSREPFDSKKEKTGVPGTVSNAGEIQREVNAGQKVYDGKSGKYIPVSTTQSAMARGVQADKAAYINNPYGSKEKILKETKTDAKPITKSFWAYGGPLENPNALIQDIQNNPQQANIDLNKAKVKELEPNGHYTRQMIEGDIDPNSIYNPTTRKEGLPYKTIGNRFNDVFTRGNNPIPHLRQDNIKYGLGGDIGAGIYGAAEGVLDTATFGLTDKLTDKVKFNDPQSEAIRAGANVAGNVAGAVLNPAAVGTAVSQSGDNLKDLANTGVIKNDNLNTALNVVGTGAEIGGGFIGGGTSGAGELGKFAQGAQDFSQNPMAKAAMGMFAYGGYINKYENGGNLGNSKNKKLVKEESRPINRQAAMPDWFKYGELPARANPKKLKTHAFQTKVDPKQTNLPFDLNVRGLGASYDIPLSKNLTLTPNVSLANVTGRQNSETLFNKTALGDFGASLKLKFEDGGTINPYACGGTMKHGDGGNLPNTTVYNGLTHEQGGLPLGNTNNEVEDGEVRWDNGGESYIFSNRF